MGKLVRVLVVVCLLLSIGALILGIQLFGKRELLKGRTEKLEHAIIQLGALIEDKPPQSSSSVQYPERDISPTTTDYIDDQEFTDFWPTYSNSYENADASTMNLKRREIELMTYYKTGPDGKVLKNARGVKVTSGEGTMQGLLDALVTKAERQYNLLNDTRQQMADTRAELVAANQNVNEAKVGYRQTLADLKVATENVARMQGELQIAKNEAAEAKEAQRALEDAIAEERRQLQFVEEQKIELEDTITQLKDEIAELRGQTPSQPMEGTTPTGGAEAIIVDPGVKGSVVAVNETWNFVILALSDETMTEILGENRDQAPAAFEFMIKREIDGEDTFVTKVRVQQVRRDDSLAIASILGDWQQMDVREGDIVFR